MFRRNWRRVDGRLIESRTLRPHDSQAVAHPHECLVEFTGEDGTKIRLTARASIVVVVPDKGGVIPLLVSPDDSKAVVDKRDPRVNLNARAKARLQAEKAQFDRALHSNDG
jgi:hypothetical protein